MATVLGETWLEIIIEDKKTIVLALKYLKTINIGGSKGVRERKLEWERKQNQASKDLLE